MTTEPHVLIPAGGSGTRLWPVSRSKYPKFLADLGNGEPLLINAVKRALQLAPPENITVITGVDHVRDIETVCGPFGVESFVCEPTPRDTGPAIAVGTMLVAEIDPDAVVVSMPADHVVRGDDEWRETMTSAVEATKDGHLVTIGIPPREPDTSLGYIHAPRSDMHGRHRQVLSFREKPDWESALKYIESSAYFWNAGIFVWRAGSFVDALREHAPALALAAEDVVRLRKIEGAIGAEAWGRVPRISIDYALCEPCAAVGSMRMVPATFAWWDLGTWPNVFGFLASLNDAEPTEDGFVARLRTGDCFVHQRAGEERRIALLGVSDLMVVDAGDVLLIADRRSVADVKDLVGFLASIGWDDVL
jgi:mannose-1-phosphate guanylyltransferase